MGLLLISSFLLVVYALEQPGVKFEVHESLIQTVPREYLPQIIAGIRNYPPEDLVEDFSILFAQFEFKLHDISIDDLQIDYEQSTLQLDPLNQEILFQVAGLNFDVSMQYQTSWLWTHVTGGIEFEIKNGMIVIPITIANEEGKIKLVMEDYNYQADSIQISTNTDSWLLWVTTKMSNLWPIRKISEFLTRRLIIHIYRSISHKIEKALQVLPYTYKLPNMPVFFDYHPIDISITPDHFFSAAFNSTFSPSSYITTPMEYPESAQKLFKLQIQESLFNSFLQSAYSSQLLKVFINSEDMDDSDYLDLTTEGLRNIIPELFQFYGEDKRVDVLCLATSPPQLSINNTITGTFDSKCVFYTRILPNYPLFSFSLQISLNIDLNFSLYQCEEGVCLRGAVDSEKTSFSEFEVATSLIGPVNMKGMRYGLNILLNTLAKRLNTFLETNQLPLPIPAFLSIQDAQVEYLPGVIEVSANQ